MVLVAIRFLGSWKTDIVAETGDRSELKGRPTRNSEFCTSEPFARFHAQLDLNASVTRTSLAELRLVVTLDMRPHHGNRNGPSLQK